MPTVAQFLLRLATLVAPALAYRFLLYDPELAASLDRADAAHARVREGMTRVEAQRLLGDAWHRAVCDERDCAIELYFYGSRDLRKTGDVSLYITKERGRQIADSVGSGENNQLFQIDRSSDLDLSQIKGL